MHKIIWAPSALDDIELIAQFIERDSSDQASLFVSRVIEMTDQLERFPLSGRVIPEMSNANCRELIYGVYRIMYRVTKLEVWIVGVIHGARNWPGGSSRGE
ncbi:MAG TPA: type II toxin-antitoxin system RelE/ParE family toxin [Candidatus Omnitrophica bacterium]|nr:type II toxin-antitoxin system RelE/ParE family toxin [Candidatus Omnitrophota bacterium]